MYCRSHTDANILYHLHYHPACWNTVPFGKLADDTELGGVVCAPYGCATTQRDIGKLEKQLSKWKWKVLYLRRNNPNISTWGWLAGKQKRTWWTQTWMSAGDVLLWQRRPTASWASVWKAFPAGREQWSSSSTQLWWDNTWSAVLCPPVQQRDEHPWAIPEKDHKDVSGMTFKDV